MAERQSPSVAPRASRSAVSWNSAHCMVIPLRSRSLRNKLGRGTAPVDIALPIARKSGAARREADRVDEITVGGRELPHASGRLRPGYLEFHSGCAAFQELCYASFEDCLARACAVHSLPLCVAD